MKGLELSQQFFEQWGLPAMEAAFPDLVKRMAVGRFEGSDAIGADDELSRDHMWGSHFRIYLTAEDHEQHGLEVEQVLNAEAPRTPREWMCCLPKLESLDSFLYFLRHGALFYDGLGEFTRLRAMLHDYPQDIYLLCVAQCCWRLAHYGEYNFAWRLVRRQDLLAAQMAVGHFVEASMRVGFLLQRDYSPYWKWLPHEFAKLPIARALGPSLEALAATRDLQVRCRTFWTFASY